MPDALLDMIANENVHVREMLGLARVAGNVGLPGKAADLRAKAENWARDWRETHPRLFDLFASRCGL